MTSLDQGNIICKSVIVRKCKPKPRRAFKLYRKAERGEVASGHYETYACSQKYYGYHDVARPLRSPICRNGESAQKSFASVYKPGFFTKPGIMENRFVYL